MPFLSSLIGLLQTKYFLTPLMGHCDLEIVLNPNFYISSANAKIPWEVSGFEMHCQLISFQDPIIERLKAVAATTGIYIHGQQWSGYKEAISANTNTIVISERLRGRWEQETLKFRGTPGMPPLVSFSSFLFHLCFPQVLPRRIPPKSCTPSRKHMFDGSLCCPCVPIEHIEFLKTCYFSFV
jgi:hypothetical protein